jgi:hypothetical protein
MNLTPITAARVHLGEANAQIDSIIHGDDPATSPEMHRAIAALRSLGFAVGAALDAMAAAAAESAPATGGEA